VNVRPNLKSVALPVPEIIGVLKNFDQSLDTPFKVIKVIDFGTNRKRVCDFLISPS